MRFDITGLFSLREAAQLATEDDRIVLTASSPDKKQYTLVRVRIVRGVFMLEKIETL